VYEAGSLADQSFRAAMTIPRPPTPDWGGAAEVMRATGKLPKDDPEHWFPASVVGQWFEELGFEIAESNVRGAADELFSAKCGLIGRALFYSNLMGNAAAERERAGPTKAVLDELAAIAKSAERIRAALSTIRSEILLGRARGGEAKELGALHLSLHQSFRDGQLRRQQVIRGSEFADDFDLAMEVGSSATIAPSWLEEGLALLAATAASIALTDTRVQTPTLKRLMKPVRDQFIHDVAKIWCETTGTRPTVQTRDDQVAAARRSGFQGFHERVCGHIAGLYLRDRALDWETLGKQKRGSIKTTLESLGLGLMTPMTLAKHVRGIKFHPNNSGSNRTPDEDRRG
jgi:hypothetical protein